MVVFDLSLHGAKSSTSIKVKFKGDTKAEVLNDKTRLALKLTPELEEVVMV